MTEPLSPLERRLLGVLVEKALTAATPEPLTLNAIVLGSNQKSNRDPVVNLEEPEVDNGLEALQRKGLVFRITGGRTERWRHNLYDAWKISKPELAILTELLLRGPQTAAEVRSRASRMESIDSEEAIGLLRELVARGLVVWLTPEARRGAILTHGFHSPDEVQRLKVRHVAGLAAEEAHTPPPIVAPEADRSTGLSQRLDHAEAEIAALRDEVQSLRAAVRHLEQSLGIAQAGGAE